MMNRRGFCCIILLGAGLALGAALALSGDIAAQSGFDLSTGDGLALHISNDGRIESLQIDGEEWLVAPGGFSIRVVTTTASANIVPNPGFELGTGLPTSWTLGADCTWDATVAHSGTRSLKMHLDGPPDGDSESADSAVFPLAPNTLYEFSAWIKTEDANGTYPPAIYVLELDAGGDPLLEEGDCVQHGLDGERGTSDWTYKRLVFTSQPDAAQALVYANIWHGYGSGWFDDLSLTEALGSEPELAVTGSVTQPTPSTLLQSANVVGANLLFTATYRAFDDHIRIDGQVQDTAGVSRALQLAYTLPVSATGWVWGDDILTARTIEAGRLYRNVQELGEGRWASLYPFASLTWPGHGALSLACPMDVPRIQRLSYDTARGYRAEFDLGLSPLTLKLGPGRATFSILLYRHDPEWGFRSAVQRYYDIFPQFFEVRAERAGLWIYGTPPSQVHNPQDFGFAFDESGLADLPYDNVHDIYAFKYIEPWGWWRSFGPDPTRPSYEVRMSALISDALYGTGGWNSAPLTLTAQAVLTSAPLSLAGTHYLDAYDYFWHEWGPYGDEPVANWYQNYSTNPDPDLPYPNRATIAITYEIQSAFDYAAALNFIDGWTFDAPTCAWVSDTVHSGSRAARVSITAPLTATSGVWESDPISVTPGATYVLAAWVKGQGLDYENGGPGIYAVELDAGGKPVDGWIQHGVPIQEETFDWQHTAVTFTASSETAALFVYGNLWESHGDFWFDDLSLHKAGSTANLLLNPGFEDNARGEETQARVDGVYFDSLLSGWAWPVLENYCTAHWAGADQPLVFSYETKQPVLLELFAHHDFISTVTTDLHANGRLAMANCFVSAYTHFAHMLDEMGSEIFGYEPLADAACRRTLSYHKPNCNMMQWHPWSGGDADPITYAEMETYVKHSLFYGIFPGISSAGGNTTGLEGTYWADPAFYERDRDLFRKYIPLMLRLSDAGWEPVPHARVEPDGVLVERYGPALEGALPLYLTLHNSLAVTTAYTVTVDTTALGISTVEPIFAGLDGRWHSDTIRRRRQPAAARHHRRLRHTDAGAAPGVLAVPANSAPAILSVNPMSSS